ncbi:hypothetical protein GI374_06975 [Paracoccus sp. S-4012]|uniref:hypothetical protein n=1 Tax=Paracoccus sp. S-4012 TaxID=2665648 RepID=UPI0012AEF4CA|nr:hypothetical protein [Paracoccus sp. S-4012]MRX50193.1 hypothetical protein [Paracoccus sp. S-4012]
MTVPAAAAGKACPSAERAKDPAAPVAKESAKNGSALDTYVCGYCGSEQSAEVQPCTCPRCGHFGPVRDFPTRKTLTIRKQNDSFRVGMIVGGTPSRAPWS